MYQYEKPDNLVELFENSINTYADNLMFGIKVKPGTYEWVTYREVGARVDHLRSALAKLGIGKNDVVGIIANNRVEWAVTAFATYGRGGRFVPMYESELLKVWKYIIQDSGIKVLFVSKPNVYDQIMSFKNEIPTLEKVFLIEGSGEHTMSALEKAGQENQVPSVKPVPQDVAVLIYTSGTTGDPKGVLLTHGNFTSNVLAGLRKFPGLCEDSRSLSILPWAHSYGQTGELYTFIHLGASIGFMENPTTIIDDIATVKPTFLIAVPRVFNKIYDGIHTKINNQGGIAKFLFDMGVQSAKRRRQLKEQGKTCLFTELKLKIADKIVFKKLRDRFGGRLNGSLTGSATMNPEIAHFFFDIGIPLYDAYGMTETTPAVSMNCPSAYKLGSVGKPLDNVKIVIDKSVVEDNSEDGEIVVYGPNVMVGYHNKPDKTKEVLTEDGGVRTGDRGRLDSDGFLFITGRIKEQFKLENGKFVFPASLEEDIKLVPWVSNAMIFGEGKPYNVCVIIPDFAVLEKYARENNLPNDPQKLATDQKIQDMIIADIAASLKGKYGGYEIPKKFIFLSEDFTIENGMLTQTMKLKRRVVLEKYKAKIDSLYLGRQ